MNQDHSSYLPLINLKILKLRAELLKKARLFFTSRGILEVETPTLSHYPAVELHIDPFITRHTAYKKTLYLQTSPEYAMKRLLTAIKTPIYQINRAFRNEETGKFHNPEFTMIEWYRPGFSIEDLMNEVEDFIGSLLNFKNNVNRMSYLDAFKKHTTIDPHKASIPLIRKKVKDLKLNPPSTLGEDKNSWLDFLLTERVEPNLGINNPVILFDYPASQANLARIRPGSPPIAERFELYVKGIELCNGYNELIDPHEQRIRLEQENRQRVINNKPVLPIDNRLLKALQHGLPSCSGVSVGFDRLVMLAANAKCISEVISFPFENA